VQKKEKGNQNRKSKQEVGEQKVNSLNLNLERERVGLS